MHAVDGSGRKLVFMRDCAAYPEAAGLHPGIFSRIDFNDLVRYLEEKKQRSRRRCRIVGEAGAAATGKQLCAMLAGESHVWILLRLTWNDNPDGD